MILWSDQTTTFAGTILALGGKEFGNGGFVEDSGKGVLNFAGAVDTRAPNGAAGTLLLDPADYYIVSTAGSAPTGASEITNTALQTQLASNDVVITTSTANQPRQNGDIFVNAACGLEHFYHADPKRYSKRRYRIRGSERSRHPEYRRQAVSSCGPTTPGPATAAR